MNRSNNMTRRYGNGARATAANVQAVETIIGQVGCGFVPKQDPFRELAMEIEVCSQSVIMTNKSVDFGNSTCVVFCYVSRNAQEKYGNV